MKKTSTRLADGRELLYYDLRDGTVRDAVDQRPLSPAATSSEIRHDPLLDDWVAVTAHRQGRTYHPPADRCPLCPARGGEQFGEIPAADYDVVVFENRFPSFAGRPTDRERPDGRDGGSWDPTHPADLLHPTAPFDQRPGVGRCEVVCFTSDHDASFADLSEERAALVVDVWTDRTEELSRLPGVRQVFCFENRGREIGVTLGHPHGQIYGYPYPTARTVRMLHAAAAHRRRTGGNVFDDVLAAERADGRRLVLQTAHWTAYVPHAARWPYQVRLSPRRRVPDLPSLDADARGELPGVYLELLRRFDRIFGPDEGPTPYIAAWHQAPFALPGRADFGLHLELFTIRRTSGKLKFLAGSESGMDAFINDVPPEAAADRLREVASQ